MFNEIDASKCSFIQWSLYMIAIKGFIYVRIFKYDINCTSWMSFVIKIDNEMNRYSNIQNNIYFREIDLEIH